MICFYYKVMIIYLITFLMCCSCVSSIDSSGRQFIHTLEQMKLISSPPLIDVPPCRPREIPVFVHSSSSGYYVRRRTSQRETWIADAKQMNSSLRVIFVMAKPRENIQQNENNLNLESKFNKDILQFNFTDSYYNLTLKHLSWMHWSLKNCNTTPYIIKIDDDILLNVKRLERILNNKSFKHGINGILLAKGTPVQDPNHKWFMPKNYYPGEYYPEYVNGPFYVLTRVLLDQLYQVSINQKKYPIIDIDDVYVTGIAAQQANISRFNTKEYLHFNEDCLESIACDLFGVSAYEGCGGDRMKDIYLKWKSLNEERDCLIPRRNKLIFIAVIILTFIFALIRRFKDLQYLFRNCLIALHSMVRFLYSSILSNVKQSSILSRSHNFDHVQVD